MVISSTQPPQLSALAAPGRLPSLGLNRLPLLQIPNKQVVQLGSTLSEVRSSCSHLCTLTPHCEFRCVGRNSDTKAIHT